MLGHQWCPFGFFIFVELDYFRSFSRIFWTCRSRELTTWILTTSRNTLSWSRAPLQTSRVTSTPLWISLRGNGLCTRWSSEISYLALFSQCRSAPWLGALAFISAGAGPSILLTAGVMQFHLVPRPLPQTILIFFLAISPLISFTAVLTAAIMCQVLKYLVLFPFISLCN